MTDAGSGVADRCTTRLRLRRPTAGDLDQIVALHTDPANYPARPDGAHTPVQAAALARAFLEHWSRNGIGYWMVERDGALIGMAGITATSLGGERYWNLYYRLVPAARGQGLAAEVCREAIAVGATLAPRRPVLVRTRPSNAPAQRLAQALGLVRHEDLDDDAFIAYRSAEPPGDTAATGPVS